MEFLNKAYSQLAELFRSMTPGARITAALLLVVVVISLAYLFHYRATGGEEYLLGGREFSHSELASMETSFAKAGLKSSEIVGNRIRVPRGQKYAYLAALADSNSLPDEFLSHTTEATSSSNVFESQKQREEKLKNAKQKDLSLVISRMNGIEVATVQFDEASQSAFNRRGEKSAMVAVKATGNQHLDDDRVKAIRNTVAASIAGMKRENVTVTDLNAAKTYSGGSDGTSSSPSESAYAGHKKMYEETWRNEILLRLAKYPGVVVGVNVELDPELNRAENRLEYDPKSVAVSTVESTKNSTTSGSSNGGRPGAAANGVNNTAQAVGTSAGVQSQTEETQSRQEAVTTTTSVVSSKTGLLPKRVTASIGVPSSYYLRVWRERNPTAKGEEPKQPDAGELARIETETRTKISDIVVALLPPGLPTDNPASLVAVTTDYDLAPEVDLTPTVMDRTVTWLADNWQTMGMALVGLVSLWMLRGMIRAVPSGSPPAAEISVPLTSTIPDEEEADTQDVAVAGSLKRRFRMKGPNLRDELQELVKEDPDAAANVLRNWIGDAA
jgi:flagellar M-ring protein FliF